MAGQKKPRTNASYGDPSGNGGRQATSRGFGIPWPEPKPDLATAVKLVESHATRPFQLKQIVKEIQQHARIRNPKPLEHIRSLLAECPDLALVRKKERYIPSRLLFRNAAFHISPSERELTEGILFPGHRFYPFGSYEVPPNELLLSSAEVPEFPRKAVVLPLQELMIYYASLGMAEMLELCRPTGESIEESLDSPVEVDVYDLSAFYRAHDFSDGDLIRVRVLDFDTGSFRLEYAGPQTGLSRESETERLDRRLGASLRELMQEAGPEPPLVVLRDAYARLFEEGADLSQPPSPLGVVLTKAGVELAPYYDRPCFVPSGEEAMAYYGILSPREYDGRCETIEDLFVKADLSIDMAYLRAAILEDLDARHEGKALVVERLFTGRDVFRWDEEDWAFFRQELDRLWEEMLERRKALSPNRRVRDLRRRILRQCDGHLAFLRQLDEVGTLPSQLPQEELAMMATVDGLFVHLLEILESAPDREDLQAIEDQLENLEKQWTILTEKIEAALDAEEDSEEVDEDWDEEDWDDADWEEDGEEDEDWGEESGEVEIEGPVTAYVFKVKFKYAKAIWRKIEVADRQTLHDLHLAIQDAIEWDGDHLYSFFLSNRPWDADSEFASPYGDDGPFADEVTLAELGLKPKQKFLYLFDYGDSHELEVEVVEIRPNAQSGCYPKLIDSKGEAPEQYPEE